MGLTTFFRALLATSLGWATLAHAEPVELILHNPVGAKAPSTGCHTRLCSSAVELIDGAKTSVDFALYGIRGQPAIFDALVNAQKRGVRVRGVIDRTLDGINYYSDTEDLVKALGDVVHDDLASDRRTAETKEPFDPSRNRCWLEQPTGFKGPRQCTGADMVDQCAVVALASREELTFQGDIMHNKFFVVDGEAVWMGSTNTSNSGTGGYNANLVAVVRSPVVAGWYTKEFEQMYAGTYHNDKRSQGRMVAQLADGLNVEGYFSPQDRPASKVVRKLLQGAKKRIDVAIFFLTHKGIAADLIAAHHRGVKVRIVMDATAAKNGYAKHELARMAGIPVKIENWGGKMHMKAAAIDGRTVVTGSMNWTSAGERGNDENTLIVHSTRHAAQFHAYFDTIWGAIPDKWLQGRPDPESKDSLHSCSDKSDNDFDHLRDAEDPGCGKNPPPLPALPTIAVVPKTDGQNLIKGNINRSGAKTYFTPGDDFYDKVEIDPNRGEQWFCTTEDARLAGFRGAGW